MKEIWIVDSFEKDIYIKKRKVIPLNDIEIITCEEFISSLIGKTDERSILALYKKGYSFSNCEKLLSYIPLRKLPTLKSMEFFKNIQDDLFKRHYINYNYFYLSYLKDKKIFLSPLSQKKDIIDLLKQYNLNFYLFEYEKNRQSRDLYKFKTLKEEVYSLITLICKCIQDGVKLDKIKVMDTLKEAKDMLLSLNEYIKLPFVKEIKVKRKTLDVYEKYKEYIKDYSLYDTLKKLEDYDINDLIKIYVTLKNDFSEEDIKAYIEYYFSKSTIIDKTGEIEFVSLNYIPKEDEILFVPSFNEGIMPLYCFDKSYPSDEQKIDIGYEDSKSRNFMIKKHFDILYHCKAKVVFLTQERHQQKEYYTSLLESEYKFELKSIDVKIFSKRFFDYYVAINEDAKNSFGRFNPYHKYLLEEYAKYSNKYKGKKEYYNGYLKLSHEKIKTYTLCPFSYYLKYVVNLKDKSDNISFLIGNVFHKYMEDHSKNIIKNKLDYLDSSLSNKELFYLDYLFKSIEKVEEIHKDFFEHSDFTKEVAEESNLSYFIDDKTEIIGKIDNYFVNEDKHYLCVIDYKTESNPKFNIDDVSYGVSLQLPLYLLLLEDKYRDYEIIGLYLLKILSKEYIRKNNENDFSFSGITRGEEELISALYTNNAFLAKLNTKNTTLSKNIVSKQEFEKVKLQALEYAKKANQGIRNGEFEVSPCNILDHDPCKYCSFEDICYKNFSDKKIIKRKKENDK